MGNELRLSGWAVVDDDGGHHCRWLVVRPCDVVGREGHGVAPVTQCGGEPVQGSGSQSRSMSCSAGARHGRVGEPGQHIDQGFGCGQGA